MRALSAAGVRAAHRGRVWCCGRVHSAEVSRFVLTPSQHGSADDRRRGPLRRSALSRGVQPILRELVSRSISARETTARVCRRFYRRRATELDDNGRVCPSGARFTGAAPATGVSRFHRCPTSARGTNWSNRIGRLCRLARTQLRDTSRAPGPSVGLGAACAGCSVPTARRGGWCVRNHGDMVGPRSRLTSYRA